ncbi:hypothetical protein ARD30_07500 [Bosea thiooxidans]|uniref:Uncharacterized membrane protein n=1 Tax=Bosea thiooxidans TaxID=53254 RepID=A0A0Q3KQW1_9HYPH|nr:hypothetical protein [Bosea thiooxidans]KQK32171.1 hypothetical protein ARD30_07500 [Bosea thiooxidans]SKB90872.1 Uncharacterized membrane protein [Bosea thiooxidans]
MNALDHGTMAAHPPAGHWRARLRAGLARAIMTTLAGLMLAAIVHIVTILAVPALSQRDAAHAYRELGTEGHAALVPPPGNPQGLPPLREADPDVVTAICSYDLSAGPVRVVARTGALPLGLTLHRQGGGVIYAITDRAAIRDVLEFLVMTEAQRDERIAADEEGETSRELRVVSDTEQGLIVARVLMRLPSDRADAEALATGVACETAG